MDHAWGKNLSTEAAAVKQTFDYFEASDRFQVTARFAQPDTTDSDLSYPELRPHKMVERHTASDEVASGIARGHFDTVIPLQRLDRFCLDKGEFIIRLRLEEGALAQSIAVALEAHTRSGDNAGDSPHRVFGFFRDMDRFDRSLPHGS